MVKIKYIFQAWANGYLKCISPDKYVYGWLMILSGFPGFFVGLLIGSYFGLIFFGLFLGIVFYILLSGIVAYYLQMYGWFR